MNREPEISSTAAAPIATTQGLGTSTGRIPAPSRILEVLIASALSNAKTSPRRPSATHVAAKPLASATARATASGCSNSRKCPAAAAGELGCRCNHKAGAWKMHANLADLTITASDHDLMDVRGDQFTDNRVAS